MSQGCTNGSPGCPPQTDLALHSVRPDAAVAGHLATCAACRAVAQDYASLATAVAAMGPSIGFGSGRLEERVHDRGVPSANGRHVAVAVRAVAALLLVIVGLWVLALQPVNPAAWSMRGSSVGELEARARRLHDGALEISWRPLEVVTRYDVRVWDGLGRLLAQRTVPPGEAAAPVRMPVRASGELLWLVQAFDKQREVASSGVQAVLPPPDP